MTIWWAEVGIEPIGGDPATVRSVGEAFTRIAGDVGAVSDRLNAIGAALGPQVWTGPAAMAFGAITADVRPLVRKLVDDHTEAAHAVADYANAMEKAQEAVERAATDATTALRARDAAAGEVEIAESEARSAAATRRQAQLYQLEARTAALNPLLDPLSQHELAEYQREMDRQIGYATMQEAEANGRRHAAEQRRVDADCRLAVASGAALDAHDARDAAAVLCVKRLHAVTPSVPEVPELIQQLLQLLGIPGLVETFGGTGKLLGALKDVGDLPFMKFVDGAGYIADAYGIYTAVENMKRMAQEHDYLGVVTEGMDGVGDALKVMKDPRAYLLGVAFSTFAAAIRGARDIDFGDMPTFDQIKEYGPSSFLDAVHVVSGVF